MTLHAPFDIELGNGIVSGSIHLPPADDRRPAVLICCDLPGGVIDHASLIDDVVAALDGAGIAAVEFAPRRGEPSGATSAANVLDDASAVFEWMLLRDDLDPQRFGLFGCCLGAIVAAGLAARTDQVNRVCLVAPVTGAQALARLDRPDSGEPLLDSAVVSDEYRRTIAELTPPADLARHDRPVLIVRGAADHILPPGGARSYFEAIEMAGHRFEHESIALADHDCSEPVARAVCIDRIGRFFTQMVKAPHRAVPAPATA